MAIEIERKFLVTDESWKRDVVSSSKISQAYISIRANQSIRVRLKNDRAFLAIKIGGDVTARHEFEYEIPICDGELLFSLIERREIVRKTRHVVPISNSLVIEVDEFHGKLSGLTLAEIELTDILQDFPRPDWLGDEVTHDPSFMNENLARSQW